LDIFDTGIICSSPLPSRTNGHYVDMQNMSNISTYSCASNEPLNNSTNHDVGYLIDQIKELEHTTQRQQDTIQDQQRHLHTSEENYTALQTENKNLRHKIVSLQATAKQHDVLLKEYEQQKELSSMKEMENSELKSKIQQMKRESQAHKQEMKHQENQIVEITTNLEIQKVHFRECQEFLANQNEELEKLRKECSQYQHRNDQQYKHILELQQIISDHLTSIKHLQCEKDSLATRLVNMEDDLLSAHSQLSQLSGRKVDINFEYNSEDDDNENHYSLTSCTSDQHPSIYEEFQAINELPQMCSKQRDQDTEYLSSQQDQQIQTSPKRMEANTKSVSTQTTEENDEECNHKRKRLKCIDQEPEADSTSDVLVSERTYLFDMKELEVSPALNKWIRETQQLSA
ncbi:hypothetical protein L9F63_003357, partial [Diploptera punctata]